MAATAVALLMCLAGAVAAPPPARAAAGAPSASPAAALTARRALVRKDASPASEQAAGRAAQARLNASLRNQPPAKLRAVAAQEKAAAAQMGSPATGRTRSPLLNVPAPSAVPAASSEDAGEALNTVVTGPGGAVLESTCLESCISTSMVAPGEPVTVSTQAFNDSDPPVSEQVQLVFQQLCGTTFETMATTTVTAPSSFGAGGIAAGGAPASASFAIDPASCDESPISGGEPNYVMDIVATVVGGIAGASDFSFFYGSFPSSQTQGCPCAPDSSGAAAAQDFRGDAVDTATGAYADSFTDASTNSPGIPLAVRRNYSSGVIAAGPLGPGWTMPWFASLAVNSSTGTVTFRSENGSQYAYTSNGDGGLTAPLGVRSVLAEVTDSSGRVTGYKLTTPAQDVLSFTASGQLTSDVDATGRGLALAYGSSGQLSSVTDAAGHEATLTYSGSLLSGIALPNGTSISYGYASGLLTSVVTPGGTSGATTTKYTYTAAGLLASIVNPDGTTVLQNTYNSAGQVTSVEDGTGASTTFSYTTVNGLSETDTTDPDRGVWTDVYDGGMLLQTIDPRDGTTEYVVNNFTEPTQVTDPLGHVTTLTYDDNGNLESQTDPLGHEQSWTYDASNNLLTSTDGNGHKTTLTYNAMDQITSVTSASGGEATYSYDSAGDLVSSVDPRGNVSGATASSFTSTYTYSARLLASVTNPAGDKESFTYAAMGFPATATDAAGHVTSYGYNGQQQLASVTGPDGGVTDYGYDAAGNLTSRTDPDGHTWTYAYDPDSRVAKATDPLGKSVTYAYDGDGNQVTFTDARGRVTTTSYDADNRPAKVTYSDGTPTVSYSYDADGNVTSLTDGTGTRALAYNADGELTSGGGFSYAYDAAGNVTSRTYPDKTPVTYTYNNDDQLGTVSQGSSKTTYTYDTAGNLVTAAQPDKVTQTFTYSASGRLTKISDATSSATLDSYALKLNVDGEATSVTVTQDGKSQAAQSYGYDAAGRLTSAGSTTYAYDKAGNLTSATTGSTTTTNTYNADEELTKAVAGSTATTYNYNVDGDQDAAGSSSYSWNAAGEMTAADTSAGNASYSYDASGDLTSTSLNGSVIRGTVWDINNPLPGAAEDTSSSGSTTADYAYGPAGTLASMSTSAGTFNPVTDWLKSVTGLVSSAGTQVSETTYGPYGAASTTALKSGAPTSSIGYAGSYTRPDSGGLDNMRARDYNPATGSFTGVDPMLAVTGQPYAYASDAPDYYTDPSGRIAGPDNLFAGVVGAIVGGGGTLINDLVFGKPVKLSDVAIATISGFAYGVAADECGWKCGGAAASFVTNAITQVVNHHGLGDFSFSELAGETIQGAAAGRIDDFLGSGGGAPAEDLGPVLSDSDISDLVIGGIDPAAAVLNPLGAICAVMDNPGDAGISG